MVQNNSRGWPPAPDGEHDPRIASDDFASSPHLSPRDGRIAPLRPPTGNVPTAGDAIGYSRPPTAAVPNGVDPSSGIQRQWTGAPIERGQAPFPADPHQRIAPHLGPQAAGIGEPPNPHAGAPSSSDYGNGPGLGGSGMRSAGSADEERAFSQYFDQDEIDDDLGSAAGSAKAVLEWAVVIVGAVLVALILRTFLLQAFWIPSESMETTLLIRDRVLVNKISYNFTEIGRGDVLVFSKPEDEPCEICELIKRVIAVEGDTVQAVDNVLYVNDIRVTEPYLDPGIITTDFDPVVVPEGHIFVMGDNRGKSLDSREFGTVSETRVVGRAFVLFWPLNRIAWL